MNKNDLEAILRIKILKGDKENAGLKPIKIIRKKITKKPRQTLETLRALSSLHIKLCELNLDHMKEWSWLRYYSDLEVKQIKYELRTWRIIDERIQSRLSSSYNFVEFTGRQRRR